MPANEAAAMTLPEGPKSEERGGRYVVSSRSRDYDRGRSERDSCRTEDELHDLGAREFTLRNYNVVSRIDAQRIRIRHRLTGRGDDAKVASRCGETCLAAGESEIVRNCETRIVREESTLENRSLDETLRR